LTAGDIKIRTGNTCCRRSGYVFNGVDDYLQLNALGAYEGGANNVSGTMSAWVNIPDIAGTYYVIGVGLSSAVSHIGLQIKAGKLNAVATGGGTAKFDVIATTASLVPHKWHHVVLVHTGGATVGRPYLYLDGQPVAMTDTVNTDLTYWMNDLATWDRGAIGILSMNATTTLDFLGCISYVKWATGTTDAAAWTDAQVKQEYDWKGGLGSGSGVTAGVLCTWTLDNNLLDSTTGGGTYTATVASDVQADTEYSEMTSKLRLLAPVVADDFCMMPNGQNGSFTFVCVKAA
jgi:hypothetical protein